MKILIIESFVFSIFVNIEKRKYIAIEKLIIVYNIAIQYTLTISKEARKEIVEKLQLIQKQLFCYIINIYKTISIKTL